ncbi:hypothetical protein LINPERHAP1_LOCUS34800 [Linum perenne]
MGVYRLPACHRLRLEPERTESLGDLNATDASESALHIYLLPKRRGTLLTRSGDGRDRSGSDNSFGW